MGRFTGVLGMAAILAAAWLFSSHKRAIKLRVVAWGLGLQFAFAIIVLLIILAVRGHRRNLRSLSRRHQ